MAATLEFFDRRMTQIFQQRLTCLCQLLLAFSLTTASLSGFSPAQSEQQQTDEVIGYWNAAIQTLGGKQFWTDVENASGWRVQEHATTGHFRLLDPNDIRRAWGNELHCRQTLATARKDLKLKPTRGTVVLTMHGLIRSRDSMESLAKYVQSHGDWTVINLQYASTRKPIGDHAAALKKVIDRLGPEVTEIHIVAHSMGNLVVRHYLHDNTDKATGQQGDPRIKRMVMLGPPNQGSRLARLLKGSMIFNTVCGPGGAQLSNGWANLESKLATPTFEFGIIAGGDIDGTSYDNILLNGMDDLTVSVAETRLPGANDTLIVPALHGSLMRLELVHIATTGYLKNGFFKSETARQPIPLTSEKQP
jgi:hypothetical protein